MEYVPQSETAVVSTAVLPGPVVEPTMRRLDKESEAIAAAKADTVGTLSAHCTRVLDRLWTVLRQTETSFVVCLKPNAKESPDAFDEGYVKTQVANFGLSDVVRLRSAAYAHTHVSFDMFASRYALLATDAAGGSGRARVEAILTSLNLKATLGKSRVFFSEKVGRNLAMALQAAVRDEKRRIKDMVDRGGEYDGGSQIEEQSDYGSETEQLSQYDGSDYGDDASDMTQDTSFSVDSDKNAADGKKGIKSGLAGKLADVQAEEAVEEVSSVRRNWLRLVTFLTWLIPTRCLEWNGMKRADIQLAWREKVALCIIIFWLSAITYVSLDSIEYQVIFCYWLFLAAVSSRQHVRRG
jgi:chitin synthase